MKKIIDMNVLNKINKINEMNKMKKRHTIRKTNKIVISAFLLMVLLLSGCSLISKPKIQTEISDEKDLNDSEEEKDDSEKDNAEVANTEVASTEVDDSEVNDTEAVNTDDAIAKDATLASAFNTVENYPLQEDIGAELWLSAKETIDAYVAGSGDSTTEASNGSSDSDSPFMKYYNQYKEYVKANDLHYILDISYMGITITSEYWLKNGKCKKVEEGTIYVYDGETYITYDPTSKTGSIKAGTMASTDMAQAFEGQLLPYVTLMLEQTGVQTINGIECDVYFMDMEIMGLKGNTIFIDPETGILVKQVLGDEENGMVTSITLLDLASFDEKVYDIPSDIVLTDER